MTSKLFKEFKEFALRGNVIDLAVGVIIGGAMNKIISSIVNDLLLPFASVISGGVRFKELQWTIKAFSGVEVSIHYGNFLQNIIEFLIIAWVVFVTVKLINRFHRKKQVETPPPSMLSKQELLLTEIRDILKANKTSL